MRPLDSPLLQPLQNFVVDRVLPLPALHTLRSNRQYLNQDIYKPRHQSLLNAFWAVYRPFANKLPIPNDARQHLDSFNVSEDEFVHVVIDRELEHSRYISLEDNKIIFHECTDPPHGEITGNVMVQIGVQDWAGGELFVAGTGNHITLTPGINNKVPDGHWVIEANQIPPNLVNQFPLNPRTGRIAPQLVLEVAVANESMPRLTQIDLPRYFAAGTGTRAWIGIKIFKDDRNTPPVHRWWCGWATRDYLNGQFLNSATMHRESMPILTNNNAPISTPTNITFHIDVDLLLHPMPRPQGYPATLDIDMERVRRRANSEL